jgi:predicted nucleic acid-binding protein
MTAPKIIIDTNIVSYVMRGRPEARVYATHLLRISGDSILVID